MLKQISPYALLLSFTLIATPAFADNCQTLDQQLANALINANDSSNYGDHPDVEKLTLANNQIDTILQSFKNDSLENANFFV